MSVILAGMTSDTTGDHLRRLDSDLISVCGTEDGGRARARVSAAARRGTLLRVAHGVYIRPGDWLRAAPWTRHLYAALAYARRRPDAVLCRETALALHGVPLLRTPTEIHVRTTSPASVGRQKVQSTGQTTVAARTVLAEHQNDRTRRRPLDETDLRRPPVRRVLTPQSAKPVTPESPLPGLSVDPAVVALAETLPVMEPSDAVVALDGALAARWSGGRPIALAEIEGRIPIRSPQAAWTRWTRARDRSSSAAESPGESLSRVLMADSGFATPELQHEIRLPGAGFARVDFFWRGVGLIGEFDGAVKYARSREFSGEPPSRVVQAEKRREDELRRMGFGFLRWTWESLRRPSEFAAMLEAAGVPRAGATRRR